MLRSGACVPRNRRTEATTDSASDAAIDNMVALIMLAIAALAIEIAWMAACSNNLVFELATVFAATTPGKRHKCRASVHVSINT